MSKAVLVVEDDAAVREALGQTLDLAGFEPRLASAFIVAKDHISPAFEGVILSDIRMPGRDGLYLLDYAQKIDADLPVILLTGEGDIPTAVSAMSAGAFDFLEKPCSNDVLIGAVTRALKARQLVLENRRLKSEVQRGDAATRMLFGQSAKAEALREQVRRAAGINGPVLVTGAPGTGVAKVADVVHRLSDRADHGFQRVPSASLGPDELTQHLSGSATGTLFLDEITAMPPETQFRLQEHLDAETGARVLVGSTADLQAALASGGLNADLYYQLDTLKIRVPALSERPEDIPVIFRKYVAEVAETSGSPEPDIPPDLIASLMARDWPGNTRALRNEALRLVLGLEPLQESEQPGLVEKLEQVERTLLIDALKRHRGNASATAEDLKLPRKTLYDKFARHGIKPGSYR
ncbi:MAG: sigma-54-dependent transcriptional regulator [Paracoccaceae bacterium]